MSNFTENAIKRAFIKLLEEKPYSDITVKDIVSECGINRNSFYYHFQDIPDLLEELVKESLDSIISAHPSFSSIEECLLAAVEFSLSNKRALLHIYRSVDRDLFERYLWKTCEYAVQKYGDTVFADRNINEKDKKVILQYYKCECFGQVMAWMETGMKDDIRSSFHRLCELKQGHTEEMIDRSEKQ